MPYNNSTIKQSIHIMKKIIVPTDFSYTSKDALAYAISIAPLLKASVEVVHIYSGTFSTNTSYPYIMHAGMGRHESLMKDLEDFINFEGEGGVTTKQKVAITCKAIGGMTGRELIKLSKDPATLMIVMGKTGKSVSSNRLFGSIARDVSTTAHCPVLLVPKEENYTRVKNILYASDYGDVDQFTLKKAVDFASLFKAAMHFVHITENSTDKNYKVIEDKIFNFLFRDKDPDFTFNLVNIKYPNVIGGLNQYIRENKIDLLIMVSHHRNFISRLFLKSTTKEMAHYSHVPILVFHKE